MKTMKQVLAEFQRMQNRLCGNTKFSFVDVRTYIDGDYWTVKIHVSHYPSTNGPADIWEVVEWTHYRRQDEQDEERNLRLVEEFKKKFNLK